MDLVFKLNNHSLMGKFLRLVFQPITYPILGAVVKLAVWRHNLKVIGKDRLMEAYKARPSRTPLITISNHHSCLDDFILFGTLLSLIDLMHVDRYRWSLTAVDVCFTNARDSFFFTWGHGIPVWRGVYQPSMTFCLDLLNRGKWIHVYPQVSTVCGFAIPIFYIDKVKPIKKYSYTRIAESKDKTNDDVLFELSSEAMCSGFSRNRARLGTTEERWALLRWYQIEEKGTLSDRRVVNAKCLKNVDYGRS
ncbi:unnamed protein product [Echinostoma caproni]|uniref:Tafazzin family protein n=1 Tax=Echinostoma caproni TaxID=27848 RepID=A0A183B218_9TREM|nr:unnamed protein product [Echinostoma caproni]